MKLVNSLLFSLGIVLIVLAPAHGNTPCAGKGTKLFFVNGLFNDMKQARKNLTKLEEVTSQQLHAIQDLQYDLAWIEGESYYVQLARAVFQRGVDDFQKYWLWISGLEKAPDWFDKLVKEFVFDPKILDAFVMPRIQEHLEQYSNAILAGYDVIIVSHSIGSFYANAALRALPDYHPKALQGSISERCKRNPSYPTAAQMIGNVQIAAPVAETVNGAPWISFKDDQVLSSIRAVTPVLPGNISSQGVSPQDVRGHSLIPSYLRVGESRNAIIQYIKSLYERQKYPIPYLEPAALLQYLFIINGKNAPYFSAAFMQSGEDISSVDEVKLTRIIGTGAFL